MNFEEEKIRLQNKLDKVSAKLEMEQTRLVSCTEKLVEIKAERDVLASRAAYLEAQLEVIEEHMSLGQLPAKKTAEGK